jgi:diguanylate cyclase (GGDEF)-like protein/PAS domain S-box-containing protein
MPGYIAKDKEINLLFAESERMYRKLVESVRNGIYMADARDNLFFVNQSFVSLLGYNMKDDVLGLNLAQDIFADPDERETLLRDMQKYGFVRDVEVRSRCQDGSIIILSTTSNFIRNEHGEVIGVEGIVHDVTDKKLLEEQLKMEKLKLEEILLFDERISAIRNLDKLVDFIVEKTTSILKAEKCSLMLVDEDAKELCIKGAKGVPEEAFTKTRIKLGEAIAGKVAEEGTYVLVTNIEYDRRFERKSRSTYAGRSFMSAAIKLDDKLVGVLNVADKMAGGYCAFNEIDLKLLIAIVRQSAIALENCKLYKELEYLAVTDPLTSLSNYRHFVNSIEEEIQRFKRYAGVFSLLMVDVDDFKPYNDTFGHLEGDVFLKTLGKLFVENLRVMDKVCRYGGDEFVVLLPGTNGDHARTVAEKLRRTIETYPFKKKMTISIGVAEFREPLSRFDFTLRVDRALYQAKKVGKNAVFMSGAA